jgi:ribonucleoside-diphosphate reductase alpha chain
MVSKGEFNFDRFTDFIRLGYKTLDMVNKKSWYPIPEITETMSKYNPIGLGIMGFADALIKLGIYYDSQECLNFIDKIGKIFKEVTEEDKVPRLYRRSLAPTGSLSILANCSSGIEPIFDAAFERHLTIGVIEETRDLYKSEYVKTAHQISPEWHIKVQAQWQKWIDSGVSKTVNMPNNASVEDVKNVYKLAWLSGCKGVTIFRDGSKSTQVLYSTSKKQSCSDETCTL